MIDQFMSELNSIQEIDKILRENIILKIKNSDLQNIDDLIESQMKEMINCISKLESINKNDLSNKKKSMDEISKRLRIIEEVKINYKKLNDYYENKVHKMSNLSRHISRASPKDKFEVKLMINEKQAYQDQSMSEFVETQKKKQDVMVNEFSSLVKKIREANEQIEDELKNQRPMITNLDYRVDKTKERVEETTSKLDVYLQKSSNCCLFSFIAIEVLIIMLLILG